MAWLHSVIPDYHIPFLQRLTQVPGLDMTCFHGSGINGFHVHSVGPHLPVKSVWIRNYFFPYGNRRIFWQSALGRIIQEPYDVIICSELIHNLTIWALLGLRSVHKKPIILSGYGYRPQNLSNIFWKSKEYLRRYLLKSVNAIIVYTEHGREECVRAGIKPEKIFVSRNTLDTEYLISLENTIQSEELNTLRQRFKLSDRPVLLYVGRLITVKLIDILIDTFQRLRETTLKPVLLIVGEGPEYKSLLERVKKLENVHLLGPIYNERELARIFLVSDLLVIPGRVGLTCVHGFCYGVPIITTAHGVEQSPEFEYVKHEENGYLVSEPRAELYSDIIAYLLNNPHKLNKMRINARQTAQSLTMTNMVSEFINAVKYVVRDEIRS